MEILTFNRNSYPARLVEYQGARVLISVISLNERLFDNAGNYVSQEARLIDEQIFFFVDDERINESEERLRQLIDDAIN